MSENNIITYSNKYGCVELEIVGEYTHVSTFHANMINSEFFFTIDEAEKLALITENNRLQVCFDPKSLKRAYVIVHKSSSVAALTRIKSMKFYDGINATNELSRLNKIQDLQHTWTF